MRAHRRRKARIRDQVETIASKGDGCLYVVLTTRPEENVYLLSDGYREVMLFLRRLARRCGHNVGGRSGVPVLVVPEPHDSERTGDDKRYSLHFNVIFPSIFAHVVDPSMVRDAWGLGRVTLQDAEGIQRTVMGSRALSAYVAGLGSYVGGGQESAKVEALYRMRDREPGSRPNFYSSSSLARPEERIIRAHSWEEVLQTAVTDTQARSSVEVFPLHEKYDDYAGPESYSVTWDV